MTLWLETLADGIIETIKENGEGDILEMCEAEAEQRNLSDDDFKKLLTICERREREEFGP
jgi:hypothetical protein